MIVKSSDDEGSESDLEDIDDLLQIHKSVVRKDSPPGRVLRSSNACNVSSRKTTHSDVQASSHTSQIPVIPKYKFSLASLISHEKDDEESTAAVARAEALLNTIGKATNEDIYVADTDSTSDSNVKMDGKTLASVVGDQEGGEIKVLHAMKRTEATKSDQAWYFFETERQNTPLPYSSFPSHALSSSLWHSSLKGYVTLESSWNSI